MPKLVEIATIEANGVIYGNWTTVQVLAASDDFPLIHFNFTASERGGIGTLADLKLKPADKVTVTLAGTKVVIDGWIMVRVASYDSNQHIVQISGYDKSGELYNNDVPLKGNQFKKSTFEQIAKKVTKPHGITVKMINAGKDAEKPFKDVAAIPGESVFDFVDRLARMRNLHLWSDGAGTLLAGHVDAGGTSSADLVEGQNILAASCRLDGQQYAGIQMTGQNQGGDKVSDEEARKPAAASETRAGAFVTAIPERKRIVVSESAGDADDHRIRADREASHIQGLIVEVTAIVQGWLRPDGGLWELRQHVTVRSPSLLIVPADKLAVNTIVFSQDQSGSKTTLTLKDPTALGLVGANSVMAPATVKE